MYIIYITGIHYKLYQHFYFSKRKLPQEFIKKKPDQIQLNNKFSRQRNSKISYLTFRSKVKVTGTSFWYATFRHILIHVRIHVHTKYEGTVK